MIEWLCTGPRSNEDNFGWTDTPNWSGEEGNITNKTIGQDTFNYIKTFSFIQKSKITSYNEYNSHISLIQVPF